MAVVSATYEWHNVATQWLSLFAGPGGYDRWMAFISFSIHSSKTQSTPVSNPQHMGLYVFLYLWCDCSQWERVVDVVRGQEVGRSLGLRLGLDLLAFWSRFSEIKDILARA